MSSHLNQKSIINSTTFKVIQEEKSRVKYLDQGAWGKVYCSNNNKVESLAHGTR